MASFVSPRVHHPQVWQKKPPLHLQSSTSPGHRRPPLGESVYEFGSTGFEEMVARGEDVASAFLTNRKFVSVEGCRTFDVFSEQRLEQIH